MMPLSLLKTGQVGKIARITGKDEVQKHLGNLGFVVGEEVAVVSEMAGNVIVEVKGCRIALDKSMANRIMV